MLRKYDRMLDLPIMLRRLVIVFAILLLAGCNRSPTVPPPAATDLPEIDQCDGSLVTPLRPSRLTHLTVDPSSNVYFTQEMADGSDVVFIIGAGDETSATRLTSANIMAQLGEGTGNIQSIAATSDGAIVFFFAGGTNKSAVTCFGRFDRRTNQIRILAGTQQLASATGMGASLALARGSVASSGRMVWLVIHHTDKAAMFVMQSSSFLANGPGQGEVQLNDPINLHGEEVPAMTRDDTQLATGNGETVLLTDFGATALWKIDATGQTTMLQSIVGLPVLLSAPAQDARGTIVLFAPAGNLIDPRVQQRVVPVNLQTHYPAVLMLRNGQLSDIPRDDLHFPTDYPVYAMQLQQVVYEPGRGTWLGYDAASGELIRFRITPKGSTQ